jgi:hypothetical protein
MAGVAPYLFTMPASLLLLLLPEGPPGHAGIVLTTAELTAAAVVNAAAIGVERWVRHRTPRTPRAPQHVCHVRM